MLRLSVQQSDSIICVCVLCLVTWLSPTLCDPMVCSPPGSSVHGMFQSRILEWVAFPCSGDLPDPGIKPESPALAGRFFTTEPAGDYTLIKKNEDKAALESGISQRDHSCEYRDYIHIQRGDNLPLLCQKYALHPGISRHLLCRARG